MSNIEEDIKRLKTFNPGDEYTKKIKIAIEQILAEREADKKTIAELKEYIAIAPNLDEMTATKYTSIQRDSYIRGRAEEQQKAEEIINKDYIPKQKVKDVVKEAIEIIESEQFKVIMGDMTKVGRLRWLLEKELLEDK